MINVLRDYGNCDLSITQKQLWASLQPLELYEH